ncbi:hypothetical protein MHY01S_18390 [Meiothermus hypogaeus NBRC 106114]|uniref:Uncharacterized protein n=1 Tax=Meiothermus hypogaeus NBRC 106114 TaxID=1227553 RepID=A0A511R233_9DEIN|nr:hypothetical protein MHY01S_18390 [Meiothermus hypogaeus NBRC 106114]
MRVRQAQIYMNPLPSPLAGEGDDTPPAPLRFITATPLTGAGVSPDVGHMKRRSKITLQVGLVLAQQQGVLA